MQTDNQVVRAAFEKAYPMPFACGWNNMTHEYECLWYEHAGEEPVEAAIAQHNDRYKVWQCARADQDAEINQLKRYGAEQAKKTEALTETHVLYTWLRKKCDEPSNNVVAVHMNIGHDWTPVQDLDRDLRTLIDQEEP